MLRHVFSALFLGVVLFASQAPAQALPSADAEGPDLLYQRGISSFAAGNFQEAASSFTELIKVFGAEPELKQIIEIAYYALGSAEYNLQQFENAAKAFEQYIKLYPAAQYVDEALFRIAAGLQTEEEYEKAVTAYRRLLTEKPRSPFAEDAAYQIATCYLIQEDWEQVLEAFKAFIAAFPSSSLGAQARIFLARAHFELAQYPEALTILEELDAFRQNLDHVVYANFLAIEIGDRAFEDTEYDTALRAYRRVRTREALLRMQKNYTAAVEEQSRVLARRKASAESLKSFFLEERRLARALTSAREMLGKLEKMPEYDGGLFHRIGSCFYSLDRLWEARVAFQRVVAEADDPQLRESAQFELALVLSQLRRFNDLVKEADAYLAKFGSEEKFRANGRVASIAFMRAESYVNQEGFEEAEKELLELKKNFPEFPQQERVDFYLALSVTMQERFDEGIKRFREWLDRHKGDTLQAEVEYWLPIAMYYNGNYKEAISLFDAYKRDYPMSVYTPEAGYRQALCYYALEDFENCSRLLKEWIPANEGHYFYWEALINCADSLAGIGELDEALTYYRKVTAAAGNFYFMSLTQAAKVLKALDTPASYAEMSRLFGQYIREFPESPNVIEAAYQAGWALRQAGRLEDARKFYWGILTRHGNTRAWEGFEQLLGDLRKMYPAEDRELLRKDFAENQGKALAESRRVLAARLEQAMITTTSEIERVTQTYTFADRYKMDELGPEGLAFIGSFFLGQGKTDRGMPYLDRLLTEFPQARPAAIAHVEKGDAARKAGQPQQALASAEIALEQALEPGLYMRAVFIRAEARRQLEILDGAIEDYNVVLANRSSPRALKPAAMLGIAECHEKRGEIAKAVPFYQRIYVLYGAFREAVAEAYLRSGLAFEKLNDRAAAANTYREMLAQEDLLKMPQAVKAQAQLERLGGV